MKKKYQAKVIGFKWSPKHMSKYRPVFEYKDECGNVKRYTRKKSMERTPFSETRSYIIINNNNQIYESTEKRISNSFCFMCLKVFLVLLTIIFPSITILALLFSVLATAAFCFAPNFIKRQIGKCKLRTDKIDGKITGYQKLKRRDKNGNSLYRPIIEYNYNGNIYTHMSKTICQLNQYGYLTVCEIFICNSCKKVFDIFEVSVPLIDIKKIKITVKSLFEKSDDDVKIYEPIKTTTSTRMDNENNATINIPLKTLPYKKASGWY